MMQPKTILVAPLNWGLGHATRCIPIINALIEQGFNVIIASDGAALHFLQKEFPKITTITLPSYRITYPKKGHFFKLSMLLKTPHILKTIAKEKKQMSTILTHYNINGIISDNRWGIRSAKVPSVFLTHQVNVLSGSTSILTSKIHQHLIRKFTQCWVPDYPSSQNLSGVLGHANQPKISIQHIGPLSSMKIRLLPKKYDILLLLSGPEPQRSIFEETLLRKFNNDLRSIVMVRGVVEEAETKTQVGNITILNFLTTKALEEVLNQSDIIIARSGYSSIMDLSALGKKAFFVPTPGQFEQEYLAKRLQENGIAGFCNQEHFSKEKIEEVPNYKGFKPLLNQQDFTSLFSLFHSE